MKNNFNEALQRVLKDEGGYSNDPSDSGGATNFGITIADYRKYINSKGTPQDVKNMSVDQAKVIYRARYWDALGCDKLSGGVDYTCFDYGVNSGLGRPKGALKKFEDKKGVDLINAINDERMSFLRRIGVGKNAKFMKGWASRVNRVRIASLDMAKKDNLSGPIAGTVGLGAAIASFWHSHTYLIIGAVIAVAAGVIIHFIRNKGKQ